MTSSGGLPAVLLRHLERLLDLDQGLVCTYFAASVFEPELAFGLLVVVPHPELVEELLVLAVDGLVSQRVDVEVLGLRWTG